MRDLLPRIAAGRGVDSATFFRSGSAITVAANTVYLWPMQVRRRHQRIDALGARVVTGAATRLLRVAVYALRHDATPGVLICQTSDLSAATSNTTVTETINRTVRRGTYLLALVSDGTPGLRALEHPRAGLDFFGFELATSTLPILGFTASLTYPSSAAGASMPETISGTLTNITSGTSLADVIVNAA